MPTSPQSTARAGLPANQRGLLSAEDAADYLSISTRSFGRLVAAKQIPSRRIGSLARYKLSDLDTYIDSLPNKPGRSPRID